MDLSEPSRMNQLLSKKSVTKSLSLLTEWVHEGKEIQRTFQFQNFATALAFVNRVGLLSEGANHHPDIDLRHPGWVQVRLVTHEVSAVTTRDTDLAAIISGIAGPFVS